MLTLRAVHAAHWFLALGLIATASSSAADASPPPSANAVAQLVSQVCDKHVVLLGEDARHGSGATLQAKAEVVRRLVEGCGFDAIYFESQLYDFLDLEAALKAGRGTPEMLADAIGGFWATTAEMQPLLPFLFDRASSSHIDLQGLDPQLGGATQLYSQARLAGEITSLLSGGERERCRADMARFTAWSFDAATPFDDAFRGSVGHCARRVSEAASLRERAERGVVIGRMADNFGIAVGLAARGGIDVREQAMFDNFVWLASRRSPSPRVVVWCATVHAFKRGLAGGSTFTPLGKRLAAQYGERLASIGFSAAAGAIAPPRSEPTRIDEAPSDSLEGRALAGTSAGSVFLDRTALAALGPIASRTISFAAWRTYDWSELLDGMLVFREERPPRYIREPAPLQAPRP